MNIKDEVSMVDSSKTEQLAELSAIIRNSSTIDNGIKITIENNSVARRIFKLFKDIYDVTPSITERRRYGLNNKKAMTQKEIAKEMRISRSYVSRIEKRAISKILREFIKQNKG